MLKKRLCLSVFMVMLCSCVTTEPVLFEKNVSKRKELQSRLQVASSYLQDGQPESAMRHIKIAMELDPDSAEVHEVLALTLEKMGDDHMVETEFKKMLRLDGAYTRGRANYGAYLMRHERYEDAYKQFTIAAEDVYYQNRAVGFYQLSMAADKLGKRDEAIVANKKSLSIDANFFPSMELLANYYYQEKNYSASTQYLQKYRTLAKPASASSLLLGVKLSRVFKDKNEEASFALALKNLYPRSAEYLEYLNMGKQ